MHLKTIERRRMLQLALSGTYGSDKTMFRELFATVERSGWTPAMNGFCEQLEKAAKFARKAQAAIGILEAE